jgi:hypothetical protein
MKTITILFFLVLATLQTTAQDFIINFKGTGVATTLTFIKVNNLKSGNSRALNGIDNLHLKGSSSISDPGIIEESVLIKPNPNQGQAELSFYANQSGNTQIVIFDISGNEVLNISDNLPQGTHTYEIMGLGEGVHIIRIYGINYQYNTKLISNNSFQNKPGIKYLGLKSIQNILKNTMTTVEMDYIWGDTIRYIGFANAYVDTVYDVPLGSKTITFLFALKPAISTLTVSAITKNSAISGGNITSNGGVSITEKGVCWSINPTPNLSDDKTSDGTGTGIFSSSITGLSSNTKYYVRAYATNDIGTAYGNEISFTTSPGLPTITTTNITSITQTTATSGGNITSDGGAIISLRGVCWSTSPSPTTSNSKTSNGAGTGSYISQLTGLSPSTTYYVRAYATNSVGTAYGNEDTFKTPAPGIPVLSTTAVSSITLISATSGGNIISDGGTGITAKGVCWSTGLTPTISDSKTNDGTGSGNYTSAITGLNYSTSYYVRAYATNSIGTGYGDTISFKTLPNIPGDLQVFTTIGAGYYGDFDVYVYKTDADRTNDVSRTNYFKHGVTTVSNGVTFYTLPPAHYYVYCQWYSKSGTGDIFVNPGTLTVLTVNNN